ncbi:MAG: amino acid ABC transporter substrate-binding protein [Alphaproteobacteria bacterium]|nr:amino acid ABC transporter substrate-binding protein [Alphaproteobacteria bacterium]
MVPARRFPLALAATALALIASAWTPPAVATTPLPPAPVPTVIDIAVIVPITGPLALEGMSQRNGAVLALEQAKAQGIPGVDLRWTVLDAGASPETATNAFAKGVGRSTIAVAASIFGPHMLAFLPLAAEAQVPLVTVSGTARITEMGIPWVFRFFPADPTAKLAQARYAAQALAAKRVALVSQSTAYGQSGRQALAAAFAGLGVAVAADIELALGLRDLSPIVAQALAAQPDALVLQLHAGPTALFVKQWAAAGRGGGPGRPGPVAGAVPIIAGSAMHQPATAALLEPAELAQVCAETGAAPAADASPAVAAFARDYRAAFAGEPDGFAVGQYDAVSMVVAAIRSGARTGPAVRDALARGRHAGAGATYRSDGRGNMAHDAVIVCYDGRSRTPTVTMRYENVAGVP